MVSDVEVGTFLSGGVDSGFIAVLSGAKMAFTVGFLDGNSGYNEENRAREVARYAHLSYHMHTIGKKEFWDVLPKVMYALDEPSGDASAVAMYFLAAKASRYVKVVLSGEGADELFGGYNIYREPLALQKVAWIPEKIRRAVSRQAEKTAGPPRQELSDPGRPTGGGTVYRERPYFHRRGAPGAFEKSDRHAVLSGVSAKDL